MEEKKMTMTDKLLAKAGLQKSTDQVVTKLEVKNGDTLLFHGTWDSNQLETIAKSFHERGLENVMILVMGENKEQTILNIPDKVMAKHGWERIVK